MIGFITLSAIARDHTLLGSKLHRLALPFKLSPASATSI
jgi:hypothetical protein